MLNIALLINDHMTLGISSHHQNSPKHFTGYMIYQPTEALYCLLNLSPKFNLGNI